MVILSARASITDTHVKMGIYHEGKKASIFMKLLVAWFFLALTLCVTNLAHVSYFDFTCLA